MKIRQMSDWFFCFVKKIQHENELPPQIRVYILIPEMFFLAGCIWPQIMALSRGSIWLSVCLEAATIGIPPFLTVSILSRRILRTGTAVSFFLLLIAILSGILMTNSLAADMSDTQIYADISAFVTVTAAALYFWFISEYRRAELRENDTFEPEEQPMPEILRTHITDSDVIEASFVDVDNNDMKGVFK